jgi:hypothetical protein
VASTAQHRHLLTLGYPQVTPRWIHGRHPELLRIATMTSHAVEAGRLVNVFAQLPGGRDQPLVAERGMTRDATRFRSLRLPE